MDDFRYHIVITSPKARMVSFTHEEMTNIEHAVTVQLHKMRKNPEIDVEELQRYEILDAKLFDVTDYWPD